MCPSASYTSQAIDCKYYTRMQPLYSTVHEAPQSRFHLVRSSTIGFCCLSASVASSQTRCHYRYHIRVCTTKTMVLHCQYNHSAVHAAFPQRFTPETTDKFGVWISLLRSFCDVCYECSFPRPACTRRLSPCKVAWMFIYVAIATILHLQ